MLRAFSTTFGFVTPPQTWLAFFFLIEIPHKNMFINFQHFFFLFGMKWNRFLCLKHVQNTKKRNFFFQRAAMHRVCVPMYAVQLLRVACSFHIPNFEIFAVNEKPLEIQNSFVRQMQSKTIQIQLVTCFHYNQVNRIDFTWHHVSVMWMHGKSVNFQRNLILSKIQHNECRCMQFNHLVDIDSNTKSTQVKSLEIQSQWTLNIFKNNGIIAL